MGLDNPIHLVFLLIVLGIYLGMCFIAGRVAEGKGRSFALWAGLTFLLWPIVLLVFFLPSKRSDARTADRQKQCPDCAEWVQYEARVCKHCGYRFDGDPVNQELSG
jgi:hypothetical protein